MISIFAILSFFTIGAVVDYYLVNKRVFRFNLANFFGLGIGAVLVLQMLLAVFEVPLNSIFVYLVSAVSVFLLIFNRKIRFKIDKKHLFLLLFAPIFIYVAVVTFSHQPWGYDAVEKWLAKAYAFWWDSGISRNGLYGGYQTDDPNLWPVAAAWLFHFLGNHSDFWVQLIPLTALMCLVGEFKRRTNFLWTIILVFTPFVWGTVTSASYSGNADLLVSFYLFLGFAALFDKKLTNAAVFFAFASLTKNDAMPAFMAFCLLLPIFKREKAVLVAWGFLAFNIAWKAYFGLQSRYLESDLSAVLTSRPVVEYTRYSINAFREEFRFVHRWGVGFLVILFFLITRFKVVLKEKFLFMAALVAAVQFAGYMYVYYVTKEDQASQIATSIFRLALQVYPSLLLFAYVLSKTKR